jgi:hypothetical protein
MAIRGTDSDDEAHTPARRVFTKSEGNTGWRSDCGGAAAIPAFQSGGGCLRQRRTRAGSPQADSLLQRWWEAIPKPDLWCCNAGKGNGTHNNQNARI